MLYLVTDRSLSLGRSLVNVVEAAVRGGVKMVQLREKNMASRDFIELAREVNNVLVAHDVPLIINDRADIAMIIGAGGLHIGQSDIGYQDARWLMGSDAIIGLSLENLEQAKQCANWDLDYVAASPVFDTNTKTDTAPALGLEGIREIRKLIHCPIVAIGGINKSNIGEVIKAGADSIAVVSAICSAIDPCEAAWELVKLINENK